MVGMKSLADHPVVVILGAIAAIATIYAALTTKGLDKADLVSALKELPQAPSGGREEVTTIVRHEYVPAPETSRAKPPVLKDGSAGSARPDPETASEDPAPTAREAQHTDDGAWASTPLPPGEYIGSYVCAQGETNLVLAVDSASAGSQRATFNFRFRDRVSGSYAVLVKVRGPRRYDIVPVAWIDRPRGYSMTGAHLEGDPSGLAGRATLRGCSTIALALAP